MMLDKQMLLLLTQVFIHSFIHFLINSHWYDLFQYSIEIKFGLVIGLKELPKILFHFSLFKDRDSLHKLQVLFS